MVAEQMGNSPAIAWKHYAHVYADARGHQGGDPEVEIARARHEVCPKPAQGRRGGHLRLVG